MKNKDHCSRYLRRRGLTQVPLLSLLVLLVAGAGNAWAILDPSTCNRNAEAVAAEALLDPDSDGTFDSAGNVRVGGSIQYTCFLAFSNLPGACGYSGAESCYPHQGRQM